MQFTANSNSVKKVAIIGPECSGKSELSEYLAGHFDTCWVPEYARSYLDNLGRPYEESDLLKIAHGQIRLEDEWLSKANRLMVCDTNLIVIKIWSEFKYGRCREEILRLMESRNYDLFLFTNIDIPWQHDPQREQPNKRDELWNIYKSELSHQTVPVVEIKGQRETRRSIAVEAITRLMRSEHE